MSISVFSLLRQRGLQAILYTVSQSWPDWLNPSCQNVVTVLIAAFPGFPLFSASIPLHITGVSSDDPLGCNLTLYLWSISRWSKTKEHLSQIPRSLWLRIENRVSCYFSFFFFSHSICPRNGRAEHFILFSCCSLAHKYLWAVVQLIALV